MFYLFAILKTRALVINEQLCRVLLLFGLTSLIAYFYLLTRSRPNVALWFMGQISMEINDDWFEYRAAGGDNAQQHKGTAVLGLFEKDQKHTDSKKLPSHAFVHLSLLQYGADKNWGHKMNELDECSYALK